MIRRAGERERLGSLEVLIHNLQEVLKRAYHGNVEALARAAGVHHSSLAELLSGNSRLGLDSLMRLSYAVRIPADALVTRWDAGDACLGKTPELGAISKRTCKKYDWDAIRLHLRQAVETLDYSMSLASICRQHGAHSGYVASVLKEEAKAITGGHQASVSSKRLARVRLEKKALVESICDCLEKGQWPSQRRVGKTMGSRGLFKDPTLERARDSLIRKEMDRLGLRDWWKSAVPPAAFDQSGPLLSSAACVKQSMCETPQGPG